MFLLLTPLQQRPLLENPSEQVCTPILTSCSTCSSPTSTHLPPLASFSTCPYSQLSAALPPHHLPSTPLPNPLLTWLLSMGNPRISSSRQRHPPCFCSSHSHPPGTPFLKSHQAVFSGPASPPTVHPSRPGTSVCQ